MGHEEGKFPSEEREKMKVKALIAALELFEAGGNEDISPQGLINHVFENKVSDTQVFLVGEKEDINELLDFFFGEKWDTETQKEVWGYIRDFVTSSVSEYYFDIIDNIVPEDTLPGEIADRLKRDFEVRKLVSEGLELEDAKVMVSLQC
jgi:hypothetical protein